MSTLEEQTTELRFRTGRLEVLFERFMEQTTASIRGLEHVIEEMKEEGARYREEGERRREESERRREEERKEAAKRWEEADKRREEADKRREEDRKEAAKRWEEADKRREEADKRREEDRKEAAKRWEEADRQRDKDRKEMNQRWGRLANRMGTLVQDLVAPSLPRIAREELDCGDERSFSTIMRRVRSDDPHYRREFDALYVGTKAVLLNETKSTALSEYATAFMQFLKSGQFELYFPEYRGLPLVPVFSSMSLPDDLVTYLTKNGIYAVAMGEYTMQLLNGDAVRSRRR